MDKELLFDNYFSNSLTELQEKLFNELLETDTEFKERFEFEKDLLRAAELREHREVKKILVGFEDAITESEKELPTLGRFRNWSIAASIALLIGLGWLGYNSLSGTDYTGLYEANYVEYPSTVHAISRGENGTTSLEQKAFEAYDADDFAKAISLFTELKSNNNPDYADFYLAQVHLKQGEFEKASTLFKNVIADKKEFEPEARWYLALTHLKQGEKENAVRTLKDAIADGRYNKMEAQSLLEKLD
ncbi:MAG: tetratricopeptide repeat protein [Flavobacteriaceae bacterium]